MNIKKPEVSSDLAARLAEQVEQQKQEPDNTSTRKASTTSGDVLERAVSGSFFSNLQELSVAANVDEEVQQQTGESSRPSANPAATGRTAVASNNVPSQLSGDRRSTLLSKFGVSGQEQAAAVDGNFQLNSPVSFRGAREAAESLTAVMKNPDAVNIGRPAIQSMIAQFEAKFGASFQSGQNDTVGKSGLARGREGTTTTTNADGSVTQSSWAKARNRDGSFTTETTSVTSYDDGSKVYQEKTETTKLGETVSSKQVSTSVDAEGNTGDIVATETTTDEEGTTTTTVVLGTKNEDGSYDYAWFSSDSNGQSASGSTVKDPGPDGQNQIPEKFREGQKLAQQMLGERGDIFSILRGATGAGEGGGETVNPSREDYPTAGEGRPTIFQLLGKMGLIGNPGPPELQDNMPDELTGEAPSTRDEATNPSRAD